MRVPLGAPKNSLRFNDSLEALTDSVYYGERRQTEISPGQP